MNEKVKKILTEVKKYLVESFGDKMRQVILYGSYAREDYNKDSDIDILIVVSDDMNPIEVEESLNDLLFEILLDENELCSVRAIPEKLFKEYNSPFLLNVKKEGVVI
ncbi:MAG: putative nucleotidyltransferase [Candidatus Alkanophagales archaeon MCA70_species_2]|nr:putative nucleotidyltransferase [Candidatus Alkanophaga liquidiphilum]